MKRKIAIVLVCLLVLALPVFAAGRYVVDEADLLLSSEESALEQTAEQIRDTYQFDVVLVTKDSINGGDAWQWANHYYDMSGYADDGILFLLVMDTREWAISTCGSGIALFSDSDQEYMIDQIIDDLSGADYYSAFARWLSLCESELDAGEDVLYDPSYDDGYDYDYDYDYGYGYDPQPNYFLRIVAAIAVGLLGSMIPMGILKGQIRNVRSKSGAEDYTRPGSMNLTTRSDRFLYTHTSRVRRAQNNSSGGRGGGGGVHRSSGGRSHGGSRGRF